MDSKSVKEKMSDRGIRILKDFFSVEEDIYFFRDQTNDDFDGPSCAGEDAAIEAVSIYIALLEAQESIKVLSAQLEQVRTELTAEVERVRAELKDCDDALAGFVGNV